jgi:hypothetical protein
MNPTLAIRAALLVLVIVVVVPMPAAAFELSGGVSVGGILAGTVPHLAVSPHAGILWSTESSFLFAIHDLLSILPSTSKDGAGVYNQTSIAIGYAAEKINFSVGPSLSIYSMPACGATLCGRVAGLSPGAHVQVNLYLAEPLGLSVSANVDWVGGSSLVLPGGVAAMVVAGPVFRLSSRRVQ